MKIEVITFAHTHTILLLPRYYINPGHLQGSPHGSPLLRRIASHKQFRRARIGWSSNLI